MGDPSHGGRRAWRCWGTLPGHGTLVRCAAFRPDGLLLATGDYDGAVKLWHTPRAPETTPGPLRKFRCLATLSAGVEVPALAFGRGAHLGVLVAATREGEVHSWDTHALLPVQPSLEPDHREVLRGGGWGGGSPLSPLDADARSDDPFASPARSPFDRPTPPRPPPAPRAPPATPPTARRK